MDDPRNYAIEEPARGNGVMGRDGEAAR